MPEQAHSWRISRKQRLADARRARNVGDERRAISLYKSILIEEPGNTDVALRVAPLLAKRGDAFEAWQLFRGAARDLLRAKCAKEALAVYHVACKWVPHEYDAWRLASELELKLGRDEAAFETLLDGRTHFTGGAMRAQAIALLSRARLLEPWDVDVILDLAGLYAQNDQADAALDLLTALAPQLEGARLRKLRALEFRITLSLCTAGLWLRALWGEWVARPVELERLAEPTVQRQH